MTNTDREFKCDCEECQELREMGIEGTLAQQMHDLLVGFRAVGDELKAAFLPHWHAYALAYLALVALVVIWEVVL